MGAVDTKACQKLDEAGDNSIEICLQILPIIQNVVPAKTTAKLCCCCHGFRLGAMTEPRKAVRQVVAGSD